MGSVLDVREANDVESIGEDWCQLHAVSRLGSVIEISVTGIHPIVAVIVEDHDVAGNGLLDGNPLSVSGLLINAVRKLNAKLRVDKKHKARTVNTVGGLTTKDIGRSDNLGSCLHDVGAGHLGEARTR